MPDEERDSQVLLETDVSNNTQVTYTQTPNLYGDLVSRRRQHPHRPVYSSGTKEGG